MDSFDAPGKKELIRSESSLKKLLKLDTDLVEAYIDNPYECPILIDSQGIVRFISSYSQKLIGIDPEEAIGKHIKDILKESLLQDVLPTGKADIGGIAFVAGRHQVVSRIPLKNSINQIIGAVSKGIFDNTSRIRYLHRKIDLLNEQLPNYRKENSKHKRNSIIGESKLIKQVKKSALQAATTNASVLIIGESGTGKDLLARYIHTHSLRADGPFIHLNCAAIPRELAESELFGYEGGAFTDAKAKGKEGKFELAQGGTIFLNEIGDLPIELQAKLLHVLQDYEIDRLGSKRSIKLNVRLITATNKNLQELIKKNLFRLDLFYRINAFCIQMPSLREIPADIPLIASHFVSKLSQDMCSRQIKIDDEAIQVLIKYHWPGNVRELINLLERTIICMNGQDISAKELTNQARLNRGYHSMTNIEEQYKNNTLEEAEKKLIMRALAAVDGNKSKASKILGIHRTSLYYKLKKFKM